MFHVQMPEEVICTMHKQQLQIICIFVRRDQKYWRDPRLWFRAWQRRKASLSQCDCGYSPCFV